MQSEGAGRESSFGIPGLEPAQLQSILDEIAGGYVMACTVVADREIQGHRGYSADKAKPTLSWATKSTRTGAISIFAKWFNPPRPHEARHYEWLSGRGSPIVRM